MENVLANNLGLQQVFFFYNSLLNIVLINKKIGTIIIIFIILKVNLISTNSVKAIPTKVAVIPPNISVISKLLFGNGIASTTSLIKKITIIIFKLIGIFKSLIIKKYVKKINI